MNKKAYIKNVIRTTLAEAYEKQASTTPNWLERRNIQRITQDNPKNYVRRKDPQVRLHDTLTQAGGAVLSIPGAGLAGYAFGDTLLNGGRMLGAPVENYIHRMQDKVLSSPGNSGKFKNVLTLDDAARKILKEHNVFTRGPTGAPTNVTAKTVASLKRLQKLKNLARFTSPAALALGTGAAIGGMHLVNKPQKNVLDGLYRKKTLFERIIS